MRIRLRDGRHLGVEERGAETGTPLIWLTGTPGARTWRPPDEEALRERALRLIVVERPGFGLSDPKPGRRILDWPRDLAEAADALALERFLLAGTSGAGPYLLACGAGLGARVTRLGLVACIAPFERSDDMSLARRAAFAAVRLAPSLVRRALPKDPEAFYRSLTRDAPPCDRAVLARIWDAQVALTAEALRQGPQAFVDELSLAAGPWGARPEEVTAEVVLWHGTEDAAAPVAAARRLAARLPRCTAHFVEGAGHFLHYDRWGAILDSLLAS
jgi:pimeloyl-ACP methyl ester carboxylesterase